MAATGADEDDAVLSDVEDDEDRSPAPVILNPPSVGSSSSSKPAAAPASDPPEPSARIQDLTAELEEERRARKLAEESRADVELRLARLRVFAQETLRKRDAVQADLSTAQRERDTVQSELSAVKAERDALQSELSITQRNRDALLSEISTVQRDRDTLQSEITTASHILSSGIDKISSKIPLFAGTEIHKASKYSGLPAVAVGVLKRTNDIADELSRQIDSAFKARDEVSAQLERRNYEVAIEVSQLEAAISGLRSDVSDQAAKIEQFVKDVEERDARISDFDIKVHTIKGKLDAQRPVLVEQMNYMSKIQETMYRMMKFIDLDGLGMVEASDSLFVLNEVDIEENVKTLQEASRLVCELGQTTAQKIKEKMEERNGKVRELEDRVAVLLAEKQHILSLLKGSLSGNASEVLKDAGIEVSSDGSNEDNEVYTLTGALENTVKEYQVKIIGLQHQVENLRAESSILKTRLDAQLKDFDIQKQLVNELEEKEGVANESVEGLMLDIAAAEEEILRWKMAAEQEAAAGRAVEQEFQTQISSLKKELDEAKESMLELEKKLKFKEETASAAMSAREAAVKSLQLADIRATKLRERIEELTRQIEEADTRVELTSRSNHRYICWPWEWLGLNMVRYHPVDVHENSNEMELSEPFI